MSLIYEITEADREFLRGQRIAWGEVAKRDVQSHQKWERDYGHRQERASVTELLSFFGICGVGLAIFVCFVNWLTQALFGMTL